MIVTCETVLVGDNWPDLYPVVVATYDSPTAASLKNFAVDGKSSVNDADATGTWGYLEPKPKGQWYGWCAGQGCSNLIFVRGTAGARLTWILRDMGSLIWQVLGDIYESCCGRLTVYVYMARGG